MPFFLDRTSDHETECWNARIDSRQGLAEFLDGDQRYRQKTRSLEHL
jgi:hypothetical protein